MGNTSGDRILEELAAAGKLSGVDADTKREMATQWNDRIGDVYQRLLGEAFSKAGKLDEARRLQVAKDADGFEKLSNSVDPQGALFDQAVNEVRRIAGLGPMAKPKSGCLGGLLAFFG